MSFFHPSRVDCEKKLRKKSHKKELVGSTWLWYRILLPTAEVAKRTDAGGSPSRQGKTKRKREVKMTRALKIENLAAIDETAVQILRVISLHAGEKDAAYVNYTLIAKSLGLKRQVVAAAVDRMKENKILAEENGKLKILNSVLVN